MTNFGGEECISDFSGSQVHILPVPYDATSTWIKGSEKGPEALFEASVNLEFYDIETALDIRERGIFTLEPPRLGSSPEEMVEAVGNSVGAIIDSGRFPVIVGGNHSVTIGCVNAFASRYNDLTVLQLDAHTDLRNDYLGSAYNHACSMARAREVARIVQVGIRSMSSEELPYADMDNIFFAHKLHSDPSLYDRALNRLSSNVYITIDLDVFDPSIMPSTGTPEPGGLLWYDVMNLLARVAANNNIVGFDIVELCPRPENRAPDFMAAKLLYQLLSYIFYRKGQ